MTIEMRFTPLCLLALIALLGNFQRANAQCAPPTKDVEAYLSTQKSWSIVDINDLPDDDQVLWKQYHAGLCPGLAAVDLDGMNDKKYALALVHRSNGHFVEKLVLVDRKGGRLREKILAGLRDVSTPFVVWRAKAGKFNDHATGATVTIAYDSIIYEKMEATSTQFYYSNGKIYSILASD